MTISTKRKRRRWDAYAFPGFRPQSTVRRVFGDPKARVITSLGVTVRAANAQKAELQPAALESGFELALHMRRQCPLTRRQVLCERWVVLFNELIQECLLGPVTSIFAPTRGPSDGVLAGQRWRHASRPCDPLVVDSLARPPSPPTSLKWGSRYRRKFLGSRCGMRSAARVSVARCCVGPARI